MTTTSTTQPAKTEQVEPTRTLRVVAPVVDIYERGTDLIIEADLPGVNEQGAEVTIENAVLTIRGQQTTEATRETPLYAEFEPVNFERSFNLSDEIDVENVQARISRGVLTVALPKAKEKQPRRIAVQPA